MSPDAPATAAGTPADLVEVLADWTERLFPDPARGDRMIAALRTQFGGDRSGLTASSVAAVESIARRHCRHLDLFFEPAGDLTPDVDPPGWPPVDPAEIRAAGGYVSCVERGADGIGTLALDRLAGAAVAMPFLAAAFALLDGATGVVVDLRANGGGDPATVAAVLDWLLGPQQVHFADVVYRDRVRQWWTPGTGPVAVPPEVPVAVLVGHGTFSSAEGLAYFLQSTGRATVVGSVTRGAADHITPVVVAPHVRAHLAEAFYRDPRTGTNWEGTGVVPDVRCADDDAPSAARQVLRAARPSTR